MDLHQIVSNVIKLLQGIPSELFLLDLKNLSFSMNPEIEIGTFGVSKATYLSYF